MRRDTIHTIKSAVFFEAIKGRVKRKILLEFSGQEKGEKGLLCI